MGLRELRALIFNLPEESATVRYIRTQAASPQTRSPKLIPQRQSPTQVPAKPLHAFERLDLWEKSRRKV